MEEMNVNMPGSGLADDEWSSSQQRNMFQVHREEKRCFSHTSRTLFFSQIESVRLSPLVTGVCTLTGGEVK